MDLGLILTEDKHQLSLAVASTATPSDGSARPRGLSFGQALPVGSENQVLAEVTAKAIPFRQFPSGSSSSQESSQVGKAERNLITDSWAVNSHLQQATPASARVAKASFPNSRWIFPTPQLLFLIPHRANIEWKLGL